MGSVTKTLKPSKRSVNYLRERLQKLATGGNMATISTTNLTGASTSYNNTWSTSPNSDGVNAAQVEMMIDALRQQHLNH